MGFFQTQHYGLTLVQKDEFLISGADALTELPACLPGSLAYTADKSKVYIMGLDGTWTEDTTQEASSSSGGGGDAETGLTLSSLALAEFPIGPGGSPTEITLTPTFASGTQAYTASTSQQGLLGLVGVPSWYAEGDTIAVAFLAPGATVDLEALFTEYDNEAIREDYFFSADGDFATSDTLAFDLIIGSSYRAVVVLRHYEGETATTAYYTIDVAISDGGGDSIG